MRRCKVVVALLVLAALQVNAADVETPKEVALGFYQDVFNKQDVTAIDRYLVEDFVDHNPDHGQKAGREGVKDFFQHLFKAFPDLNVTTEQMLVDGDVVTVRSTLAGTQQGEFLGMPASGKTFSVTLIDIIEIKDGKATQRWGLVDFPAMMAQLRPTAEKAAP